LKSQVLLKGHSKNRGYVVSSSLCCIVRCYNYPHQSCSFFFCVSFWNSVFH
jgi:hypothetical protein